VERRHAPVVAATGRLLGLGQRRADHHRVGPAGDGLGDVAAGAHAAVGDDVAVLTRLQQVLDAGGRGIGYGRGLRHAHAEHAARGAGGAWPDAHEHAGRPRAHQVQRRLVARAAAHDRGDRLARDELLEVERLDDGRDVLCRDDGPLDDEDVEAGLERDRVVLAHALRCQRGGREHAGRLDLLDALRDQLGLDRLRVELLHELGGLARSRLRDALELLVGIGVARPDALEVEHRQPAQLADRDRDRRRDDAVHRGGEEGEFEQVGPELPADIDILGVARAPARHDRDVIEPVGASRLLAPPYLDLHRVGSLRCLAPLRQDPGARVAAAWVSGGVLVSVSNAQRHPMLATGSARSPEGCRRVSSGLGRCERGDLDQTREALHLARIEHSRLFVLGARGTAGDGVAERIGEGALGAAGG